MEIKIVYDLKDAVMAYYSKLEKTNKNMTTLFRVRKDYK